MVVMTIKVLFAILLQSEWERSKWMRENSLAFSCKPICQRFGLGGLQKEVVESGKTLEFPGAEPTGMMTCI